MTRQRKTYTAEFKLQMVKLYENGKPRAEIAKEYELTPSALDRWIKNHQDTGSFAVKDNRSEEENELANLRKEKPTPHDGGRHFKVSGVDHGTKISVIRNNVRKYSVSAMCAVLDIPTSTYYYHVDLSK